MNKYEYCESIKASVHREKHTACLKDFCDFVMSQKSIVLPIHLLRKEERTRTSSLLIGCTKSCCQIKMPNYHNHFKPETEPEHYK